MKRYTIHPPMKIGEETLTRNTSRCNNFACSARVREPVRISFSFFWCSTFTRRTKKHTTHESGRTRRDKGRAARVLEKGLQRNNGKREKEEEAHLVDDAAGQSVRPPPPRGNAAAARHPDQRADKLSRREGEYARVGSPVHRTVFRRELSPPEGGSTEGARQRERERERTKSWRT